ncbi:MAG: ABC transporter, ATP-binding protein 1 (cluster 4, leucine/isoleucine/valine/benzoate) [Burkholderiaceae bacterium]|jgi:branched-chain amino acid transport system ATP-binding protein|nr:MAG: ABC transporter, ATP-binding protein 1 (cluster 4, leucine/isoleucine/valine/benzoate) [Burkholderiaceae bacterium]
MTMADPQVTATGAADKQAPTLLSASNVEMSFGALQVLQGVSLEVRSDELVGIIGPNGAGKTTLFSVLVGALRPLAGAVTFAGHDVTHLSTARRCRRGLVRTHQIPRPFIDMTVFENVFVAAVNTHHAGRADAYRHATAALIRTDMLGKANRRAATLGLLDRKRLELSRALATDPKVLLLDEIGGGLSEGESMELLAMIRSLKEQGIAIIWIEHIVPLLRQAAGRFVCLHQGKIIANGTPEQVMSDPTVVAAYLGGSAQ